MINFDALTLLLNLSVFHTSFCLYIKWFYVEDPGKRLLGLTVLLGTTGHLYLSLVITVLTNFIYFSHLLVMASLKF